MAKAEVVMFIILGSLRASVGKGLLLFVLGLQIH